MNEAPRMTCRTCEAPQKCPRCSKPLHRGDLVEREVVKEIRVASDTEIVTVELIREVVVRVDVPVEPVGVEQYLASMTFAQAEYVVLKNALQKTRSVMEAAKMCGVGKTTLYRKIQDYPELHKYLSRPRALEAILNTAPVNWSSEVRA